MSEKDSTAQEQQVQAQAPAQTVEKKPKWSIVNQMGRTVRPVAGPGEPDKMRVEFERLRSVGMPGSIQLLDEKNIVVEQHVAFIADKSRRGKDEDGGTYEPTIIEKGHKPLDLSSIRDAIKAMPETDMELDPSPDDPPDVAKLKARLLELEAEKIKMASKPEPKKPYTAPKVEPIEPPQPAKLEPKAQPKMPPPRSQRMASAPCQSGWSGLLTFTSALNSHLAEMRHTEDRMRRRRRRFVIELIVRMVSGAPVCGNTVAASYSDASDATRM